MDKLQGIGRVLIIVGILILLARPINVNASTIWNVGDVFVGAGDGLYYIYNNNGVFKESIDDGSGSQPTGVNDAAGCTFNNSLDKLYTAYFQQSKVKVYNNAIPHAPPSQVIDTGAINPNGHNISIVFATNGDFYVSNRDGDHDIQRYNSAGVYQQSYDAAIDVNGPSWMDLSSDQKTMFYTSGGSRVMRYDVSTNTQLPDFTQTGHGPDRLYALRLLPPGDGSGGLIVTHQSHIHRVSGTGAALKEYDAPGEDNWLTINLDPNGTSFWSGDSITGNFYRFNIATGHVEVGPIPAAGGLQVLEGVCVKGEPTAAINPPPPLNFSISGNVFVDNDKDKIKNIPPETNYTATNSTIEVYPGNDTCSGIPKFTNSDATGHYDTGFTIPPGNYSVCYKTWPFGYQMTFPTSGLFTPHFNVTVGTAGSASPCDASNGNPTNPPSPFAATCDANGNIINLNFGITNSIPWIQTVGRDIRMDAGFVDAVPAGNFASLSRGGGPGIIFSGQSTPDFGSGEASVLNWQAGNFSPWKSDIYVDTHNSVPTSYLFLLATAQRSGITVTNLGGFGGPCGGDISRCTLDSSLSNGVYIANGDLTLVGGAYLFPGAKNFVILIDGDLTIKENITVPVGSTVVFSAKGNITVNGNANNIQGLYSADKDFIVEGTTQLDIQGAAVANAALSGGSFQNNRDLGAANDTTPSVRFTERPDFIVNYPDFVKQATKVWQEVAW